MELVVNLLDAREDPAEWARRREQEGWFGIGCADHFFSPRRPYPHLWVTLATFAAATSRVRLASCFANNLFRSPVEFAQASLQLQAVSGGRFEAGLGAGWDREEALAAGFQYPPAGERAARYAEAIEIAGRLLRDGACQFHGRYYQVDVPIIGPRPEHPPPLVASLGGDRTIREIAPLVDRVEVKLISAATRGGTLDVAALAQVEREQLDSLVRKVRAANPTVPLSLFVLCSVGDDELTRSLEAALAGSFLSGFFGDPGKVAASVRGLVDADISRVQLSAFSPASYELLADELGSI